MKKRKQKQIKTFIKKHAVVLSIALGLLIVLGLTIRHYVQMNSQKSTFTEAQITLANVMDEVASEVSGGTRVSEAYCGRNSVKYGQGDRSCFIDENILYSVNAEQFEFLRDNLQRFISQNLNVNMRNLGPDNLAQQVGGYAFRYDGLSCYVEYYGLENRSSFGYLDEISNFTNGLRVSLNCSGDAMADYFPSVD